MFGAVYIVAIPFLLLSIGWLVGRLRAGRSTVVPLLSAGFCFVSAYLYLAVVGHYIPVWVWAALALPIGYGLVSTIRDVRRRTRA